VRSEDLLDPSGGARGDLDGGVRHPSTEAGGAESSLLAAQRHQLGVPALTTDQMQATVVEPPAAKVLLELLDDEARQTAVLLGAFEERRPVLRHRLVEHGAFRTVAEARALRRRDGVCGVTHASGASARSVPARKGRDVRRRASARVANCRRAGGDRHPSPDERRRHCLGRRRLPHSGEARIWGRPTPRSGGELGQEERPGVAGGLRVPWRRLCDTPRGGGLCGALACELCISRQSPRGVPQSVRERAEPDRRAGPRNTRPLALDVRRHHGFGATCLPHCAGPLDLKALRPREGCERRRPRFRLGLGWWPWRAQRCFLFAPGTQSRNSQPQLTAPRSIAPRTTSMSRRLPRFRRARRSDERSWARRSS